MKSLSMLLISTVLFTSCAGSYYAINPERLNYTAKAEKGGVLLNYRYAVLEQRGNKKYAKKETKKHIRVVAINLTNTTGKPVSYNDMSFYAGDKEVFPLEINTIHRELKQAAASYLLFLFLTPMNLYTGNSSIPIGLGLGPGIAASNMSRAARANNSFKEELLEKDLTNAVIHSGETVYGVIGFRGISYDPLSIKLKTTDTDDSMINTN